MPLPKAVHADSIRYYQRVAFDFVKVIRRHGWQRRRLAKTKKKKTNEKATCRTVTLVAGGYAFFGSCRAKAAVKFISYVFVTCQFCLQLSVLSTAGFKDIPCQTRSCQCFGILERRLEGKWIAPRVPVRTHVRGARAQGRCSTP